MKYIDTPAGKFQIVINGTPAEFEAKLHSPYSYHDNSGTTIPILACYLVSLNILSLSPGDKIEAKFERGALKNDGGGEAMANAVGSIDDYVIGIGTTDTQYLEWNSNQQLPYKNAGLDDTGFTFLIVEDPQKYIAHQTIHFIVAWEASCNDFARDIVSFMTS